MMDCCSCQDLIDCCKHNPLRRVVCRVKVTNFYVEVPRYTRSMNSVLRCSPSTILVVSYLHMAYNIIYNHASLFLDASIWCRTIFQFPVRRVLWSLLCPLFSHMLYSSTRGPVCLDFIARSIKSFRDKRDHETM